MPFKQRKGGIPSHCRALCLQQVQERLVQQMEAVVMCGRSLECMLVLERWVPCWLLFVWCLDGTGCGDACVVRCMYRTLIGGCLMGLVPRFQPAPVGWRFSCVCAFGGFLL